MLPEVDVLMMLRVQFERQGEPLIPSEREYASLFGLTEERMGLARKDVLVMHPGPINRGIEIAPEVADGPWSLILDQVTNGVAVRMAILYLLAGAAAAAKGAEGKRSWRVGDGEDSTAGKARAAARERDA